MGPSRLLPVALIALAATLTSRALTPESLRCEYTENPLSIENPSAPSLSWIPADDSQRRGAAQSAYRIAVASTPEKLTRGEYDIWDSGKTPSGATARIPCGGITPAPFTRYHWKVMLWDEQNRPGPWSRAAMWGTGPLTEADWQGAQWIARKPADRWAEEWHEQKKAELPHFIPTFPLRTHNGMNLWQFYDSIAGCYDAAPMFRKSFAAPRSPQSAMLYICGLGYFEAFINGQRVGADVLNPAWTIFDRTALYSTYDITPLLSPGSVNHICVMLGRGELNPLSNDAWGHWETRWVDQPRLIALLRITDSDGKVSWVTTDSSWLVADSPILLDDTRIGEIINLRKPSPAAASITAADTAHSKQEPASVLSLPLSTLRPQMLPPVRRSAGIPPVRRIDRPDGTVVFDLGHNIAGWANVRVRGPRNSRVLVEYCELPSDTLLVPNLHPARLKMSAQLADAHWATFHDATNETRQQNAAILAGSGSEEFECHFSYKGFRFVRITPAKDVEVLGIEGIPVHSDLRSTGSFACSDTTVNRLQEMARNTLLCNFVGIPTDCPHREKQGWTADTYFTSATAMYNFDMAQFFRKWLRDLAGTQSPLGALCTVAPSVGYDLGTSITWPAALLCVPTDLFDFYGDTRMIEELYPSMQLFEQHCRSHKIKDKPAMFHEVLGDWVSPADSILPTLRGSSITAPPEGVNTYAASSYYGILRRLERMALIAGHPADTAGFRSRSAALRDEFNGAFLRPEEAAYYGHKPTPYRLAPNVVALFEGLAPDTLSQAVASRLLSALRADGFKARTGFLGTRAMMKWLSEADPEAAFRFATQPEYPGWGYMVAQGATTMWEDWAGCASHNHIPYSLISEYFYRNLAGIRISHTPAGVPEITIAPSFPSMLRWAEGSVETLYGTVATRWHRTPSGILLSVTLPPNLTATLRLPSSSGGTLTETCTLTSGKHSVLIPSDSL